MRRKRRLLIISCSRTKSVESGLLPAWKRYRGRVFAYLDEALSMGYDDLDIVIISARYGALSPTDLIEYYDQEMTAERAAALRTSISAYFMTLFSATTYCAIFILMEQIYLEALPAEIIDDAIVRNEITAGTLAELGRWCLKLEV